MVQGLLAPTSTTKSTLAWMPEVASHLQGSHQTGQAASSGLDTENKKGSRAPWEGNRQTWARGWERLIPGSLPYGWAVTTTGHTHSPRFGLVTHVTLSTGLGAQPGHLTWVPGARSKSVTHFLQSHVGPSY